MRSVATRFAELSNGAFRPSQRELFREYLGQRLGTLLDNTQSGTFQVMLRDPAVPADVREMMELSIASNKTSTAKYAALDPGVRDYEPKTALVPGPTGLEHPRAVVEAAGIKVSASPSELGTTLAEVLKERV